MSQARRRLALLAAALSTCGAAALLIGAPAGADTKEVTYQCTAGTTGGSETTRQITVNLSGPASATAGSPYTATLVIAGASPAFTAVDAIPTGSQIQLVPQVSVSATPGTVTVPMVTATASASATASVTAGGTLAPIPTATVTVTPQAGSTSMILEARDFALRVGQAGAASPGLLYTCVVASTGSTAPAAVTAAVATATSSTSTSPSTSTTPSNTPTTSTPTPQQTHTVEVTVTEEPTNDSKVARTPEGGAATGAGGDAGPDARMFVLVGSILLLGAAAGGVVLRRRRLVRG